MGSSVGSVGSDESSGGVTTTLSTGLLVIACTILVIVCTVLVIARTFLLVLLLLVIAVAITAYLLNHAAGALSNPFSYNIPENQALPIYYID